jgi:pyridoxamine 5'-phosphate oxidase
MEARMNRESFSALAPDIIERAEILSLATKGEEPYPMIRALFNLRNPRQFPGLAPFFADKGLAVYLGTNTSSVKVGELAGESWASVYFMLPGEFKGLMLSGRALADGSAKEQLWVEGWERYYPRGRLDPDYTVLRLDPVRARGWNAGESFDFAL